MSDSVNANATGSTSGTLPLAAVTHPNEHVGKHSEPDSSNSRGDVVYRAEQSASRRAVSQRDGFRDCVQPGLSSKDVRREGY
jgi:hypothetical protein